ncbi:MAG: hypothetical protein AB8H79_23360 [Myxococcota bacterium]
MVLALMWLATSANADADAMVQLKGTFFGASFDTPLRIRSQAPANSAPASVLHANSHQLASFGDWIESSSGAVGLDDYGKLRLVVSGIDALPVRVRNTAPPRQTVEQAVRRGAWTDESRLLAIGGALRTLGVGVTVFDVGRKGLVLGVYCEDEALNVDAVEQDWKRTTGGRVSRHSARWVLWDGRRPVGEVHPDGSVKRLDSGLPRGRAMALSSRATPSFTLKRSQASRRALRGVPGTLSLTRRPDAAGYLSLAPELKFADALPAARKEVRMLGLDRAARQALRHTSGEVARLDALIRWVQGSFVYEPGPVRSLSELVESGKGDCDQLSLLLGALLLELGYEEDDVISVSWPNHLGLGVRARSSSGPDASTGVNLESGRYHLIDVTHYVWRGERLVSRWGKSAPEHGSQVTIRRLSGT